MRVSSLVLLFNDGWFYSALLKRDFVFFGGVFRI